MKPTTIKCVNIRLLPDGRQQATFEKAAAAPTTKTTAGPTTVNPPDISVSMVTDMPNDGNYAVGKEYQFTIN